MGQALESIVREGEAEGAGSDLVGESEGAAGRRAWKDGRERPSSPVGGRAASPISAEIVSLCAREAARENAPPQILARSLRTQRQRRRTHILR